MKLQLLFSISLSLVVLIGLSISEKISPMLGFVSLSMHIKDCVFNEKIQTVL